MPAKEYNEVKMRGILPSDGMDAIPVTESTPLASIQVEPKPNCLPFPVGKIPDGGTQILKRNYGSNDRKIIHTVTSGKTFYLTHLSTSWSNNTGGTAIGKIGIRTDMDVEVVPIREYYYFINGNGGDGDCYLPPIEVQEDYRICVETNNANSILMGTIHGYEL